MKLDDYDIEFWLCPDCGYRITDLQMQSLVTDVGCPRCRISLSHYCPKLKEKKDGSEESDL